MFGKTLEQLKQAFASGEEILKEDEYLGNDGLPYCKACKTARFFTSDDTDNAGWRIRTENSRRFL